MIHHCSAYSNGTAGIFTQNSGILIEDCTCSFNTAPGISIGGSRGPWKLRAFACSGMKRFASAGARRR